MSGSGAAMMLRRPLRVRTATKAPRDLRHLEAYAVSAPPASCALLGMRGAVGGGAYDLVVSGINAGPNLGRDAILSGTVGAAFLAVLEGLPAMAVSIPRGHPGTHYTTAAKVAGRLAARLRDAEPGPPVLLNVNVPNLPFDAVLGVKVTHLSHDCCLTRLTVERDLATPGAFKLLTERQVPQAREHGSDEWAVACGYVSITPLLPEAAFDQSDPRLASWIEDLLPLRALVK
ncbi:MAG: 5'/3'-nucleotidase SurE, partial [Chloroflexota bacterium]